MVPDFKLKPLALRNMPQCYINYKHLITNYHIRIKKFTHGSGILNTEPDPPDPGKRDNQDLEVRIRTEIMYYFLN
jgi:hypothetical protein